MEAFQPSDLVTVEVAPAPTDLVASHVGPAPAVANTPARKRQGNVVVHDDIPAGPAGREGVPTAATAVRSARPPTWKMNKVSGVKQKKVPTKKPPSTPFALARRSLTVPSYGATSTTGRESPRERGSLTDMDEDEDDPRNLNKPDGDKKTKEKMKTEREASTLRDKIDSMLQSNEVLLAKSLDANIEMTEKKAREKQERWKFLKEVVERKARAVENKNMANLIVEENRIMTLNRNGMDHINKE
ncbi:Lactation elevated protein 1 [Hordeum vulgare]|nr:Lactation elevated protein 1 [Hordeum vulgare]